MADSTPPTPASAGVVTSRFPIVGLGASAGGLEAVKSFFAAMPTDSSMVFVVIQHLDPTHESPRADLLAKYRHCQLARLPHSVSKLRHGHTAHHHEV
jgi:two-component system, chemotaxis family, CheB/CheR fusion protein